MRNIEQAASRLNEIIEWRKNIPETWAQNATIRSAHPKGAASHQTRAHPPMPGGLEHAIDTWDTNGPAGIHTWQGVLQALSTWAFEIAGMRGELITVGHVHYVRDRIDWAAERMTEAQWEYMTSDIQRVHARVEQLAKPSRDYAGTCPKCGQTLEWVMTDKGKVDTPLCQRRCTLTRGMSIPAQQRETIRHSDSDALITVGEARKYWPTLNANTLRSYVARGKLARHGKNLYRLGDINRLMAGMMAPGGGH